MGYYATQTIDTFGDHNTARPSIWSSISPLWHADKRSVELLQTLHPSFGTRPFRKRSVGLIKADRGQQGHSRGFILGHVLQTSRHLLILTVDIRSHMASGNWQAGFASIASGNFAIFQANERATPQLSWAEHPSLPSVCWCCIWWCSSSPSSSP
jgi:hypothetical protein